MPGLWLENLYKNLSQQRGPVSRSCASTTKSALVILPGRSPVVLEPVAAFDFDDLGVDVVVGVDLAAVHVAAPDVGDQFGRDHLAAEFLEKRANP